MKPQCLYLRSATGDCDMPSNYYLGIFIDSNLSWENHIDYIYNKIIKFVGIFYKIRYKLNFEISKMIYYAFVHSHLIYGIEIYGNTYTKYLNKLTILNNKILRILQHAPLDTPVSQLYATFHTVPLPDLHNLQILKFVHNFIHHQEKLPCIFSSYFTQNNVFHPYNTRTKDSLHYEIYRSTLGQRSIRYKGSLLWNFLSDELKDIVGTSTFINKVK